MEVQKIEDLNNYIFELEKDDFDKQSAYKTPVRRAKYKTYINTIRPTITLLDLLLPFNRSSVER